MVGCTSDKAGGRRGQDVCMEDVDSRRDTDREPEGQAHRGVPREGGEPGESQRDMLNLRKHSVLSDPDRIDIFLYG